MMQNRKGNVMLCCFTLLPAEMGNVNPLAECPGSQSVILVIFEKVDLNWETGEDFWDHQENDEYV